MNRNDLKKMRNQKQDKNSMQVDVYMFAASFSILDSVLYVSDIQFINDVTVNNKWFLKERLAFENQFTGHIAGTEINESLMTSVLFSEKEKKLIKKREKLIKRNKRKNGFKMYQISDFKFSNPVPAEE